MSGIVLSSSVRQNLLSLQSTADLLATTQSRLSTGKKVNSALDNPTNFFTATALDNRASDINNLLDGIGNGVQVLQAANTGITSLQKLVDSAKSVATQALQSTIGYSSKANFSVSINGATADNLLGNGPPADTTFIGGAATNNQLTNYSASTGIGTAITATTTIGTDASYVGGAGAADTATYAAAFKTGTALNAGAGTPALGSTLLSALTDASGNAAVPQNNDTFTVNGKTIKFVTTGAVTSDGAGGFTVGLDQNVNALLGAIDSITGATGPDASTIDGTGALKISTGTAQSLVIGAGVGTPLAALGLGTGTTARATPPSPAALAGTTLLGGTPTPGTSVLQTAFQSGDTLTVNGKVITFGATGGLAGAGNTFTMGINQSVTDLLDAIDTLSGAKANGQTSTLSGGVLTLHTGNTPLSVTSSRTGALTALGLPAAGVNQNPAAGSTTPATPDATTRLGGPAVPGGKATLDLAISATDYLVVNNKTITFHANGTTTGSIANNDLSISLADGNLGDLLTAIGQATGGTATIDNTGKINLTSSTGADITLGGSGAGNSSILHKLGLDSITVNGAATPTAPTAGVNTIARTAPPSPLISGSTLLSGTASSSSDALATSFAIGDKITVNGTDIQFTAAGTTNDATHIAIDSNVSALLSAIDTATGNTGGSAVASNVDALGKVELHTGSASDLMITANGNAALALQALGIGTASGSGANAAISVSQARTPSASSLIGQTLSFGSVGGGTATTITFGDGTGGTVKSLNDLNEKLAADNLQATLAQNGTLTITTSNDRRHLDARRQSVQWRDDQCAGG
jgi:flagellin